MDPSHLLAHELSYEIKIRGVNPDTNVEKNRKLLRGLLKQQSANRSFYDTLLDPYTFNQHTTEITESITKLQEKIDNFSGNLADNKRITSRLTHLSGRIGRLSTDSDNKVEIKNNFLAEILNLEVDFDDKNPQRASSTPADPHQSVQFFSKPIPLHKWNLHFSGDKKESLTAFLEKVECLRISRQLSKQEIFISAGDLFRDHAWTWFINNRNSLANWDELVQKLKDDFLPYHYETDLKLEIQHRTQGANERVTIYISAMVALFNRLKIKPSDNEIITTIRRNLLPHFSSQLALVPITSISELTEACKKIEEAREWSNRYRPPPFKRSGLLEPDLSCAGNFPSTSNYEPRKNFQFSKEVSTLSTVTCWNCSKLGHTFGQCRLPRNTFCFGCGLKKVTKANCPSCSKNATGGAGSLDTVTTEPKSSPGSSTDRKDKSKSKK